MQGKEGWQLQRRRQELLDALNQSIRHLLSLEEPLASWAAHSAQAEAALAAAAGAHHAWSQLARASSAARRYSCLICTETDDAEGRSLEVQTVEVQTVEPRRWLFCC
jgi:hypothetical protein